MHHFRGLLMYTQQLGAYPINFFSMTGGMVLFVNAS